MTVDNSPDSEEEHARAGGYGGATKEHDDGFDSDGSDLEKNKTVGAPTEGGFLPTPFPSCPEYDDEESVLSTNVHVHILSLSLSHARTKHH